MKCSRCGFESPVGFAFCGKCGQPFELSPDRLDAVLVADLTHLLPGELGDALQAEQFFPSATLLERSATSLNALIREAAAFLPDHLSNEIFHHPEPGKTAGLFVRGSLLYADISGFTPMTEKLSQSGQAGAEETTELVNLFFTAMLDILRNSGGHLITFGGDALLGLFLEPENAAYPGESSALQAVLTGLQMQSAMHRFENTPTSKGTFPLRMKAAVHCGHFFSVRLGSPESMGQALFGRDVNLTAAAEGAALAGQVVIDRVTLAAIPTRLEVEPLPGSGEYWRVLPGQILPPPARHNPTPTFPPVPPTIAGLRDAVERIKAFGPYLPGGLLVRFSKGLLLEKQVGEHRHTASLFANIIGLDEQVDRLGPGHEEQITHLLNQYYLRMASAIHNYEGVISKIDLYPEGEKLLVIFGAPVAHEDDAERAVRAALAMQQSIAELNSEWAGLNLSQKIGLSYGPLFAGFVGTDWRHEYTIMGDEVNLAARLMTAAAPGEILASQNVYHKVKKRVEFEARGTLTVKGKSQPVAAFKPLGFRSRPESLRGFQHIDTPLIGREIELNQLRQAAARLQQGMGQIISITGEAGMGKSRLVLEFQKIVQTQFATESALPIEWVEGRCLSYLETVSYGLFQPVILQLMGILEEDTRAEANQKIRTKLAGCFPAEQGPMAATYLANFLNLVSEDDFLNPLRFLEPEAIQRGTFLIIRTFLEFLARSRMVILLLDDIHWIDPASQKLLENLLPVTTRSPLILLLLYRQERSKGCWKIHDLVNREYGFRATEINLHPLVQTDCQKIMDHLLQSNPVSEKTRQVILQRVDGNPLYLEEILRSFIDPAQAVDTSPMPSPVIDGLEVPDTLQGVLMTRLDHLKENSRFVAQAASIIGRSFSMDLLGSLLPQLDPLALNQSLFELQQQDILHEIQRIPETIFTFKHALMQDVCYDCLSVRVRRDLHQKISRYLATQNNPNSVMLIGHHAYAGQDWKMALVYQLLSGHQAQRLFANHEAIGHFEKALESAQFLPPDETGPARQEIHLSLGELFTITTQFDQAQKQLDLAYAVATENGDVNARIQACRWLARKQELSGNFPSALEWIDCGLAMVAGSDTVEAAQLHINASLIFNRQGNDIQALEHAQTASQVAECLGHLTAMARSNNMLGLIRRNRGENQAAMFNFQKALQLYTDAGDIHGQAVSLNLIANALFNTGQWESSSQYYRQARDIFDQLGDQYNSAIACNNLGGIALNQERLADAAGFYSEADCLLQKIGASPYVRGIVQMNLGSVCIKQKDHSSAFLHLKNSQAYFDQTQTRDFLPEMNRHLARAALVKGDLSLARTHADEAHRLAIELSMRCEEGCSLRVAGEISLALQEPRAAESLLRTSIDILEEVGEEYELAVARSLLGQALFGSGQLEEAKQETLRATLVFQSLGIQMD